MFGDPKEFQAIPPELNYTAKPPSSETNQIQDEPLTCGMNEWGFLSTANLERQTTNRKIDINGNTVS